MGTNDDFYAKEFNLNCFYMPCNFEQKYPKTAIVGLDMAIQETKAQHSRPHFLPTKYNKK